MAGHLNTANHRVNDSTSEDMDLLVENLENFADWGHVKEEVDRCFQDSGHSAIDDIIANSIEVLVLD